MVDYNIPLEERIVLAKFKWVNSDVTAKSFPASGKGKVFFEPKPFYFGRVFSEDATKRMENEGFQPANIEQLLAYGVVDQHKYPIIALGSSAMIGNRVCVPYIGDYFGRILNVQFPGGLCDIEYYFLGVREVQPKS